MWLHWRPPVAPAPDAGSNESLDNDVAPDRTQSSSYCGIRRFVPKSLTSNKSVGESGLCTPEERHLKHLSVSRYTTSKRKARLDFLSYPCVVLLCVLARHL
jgi:hypothetical protein